MGITYTGKQLVRDLLDGSSNSNLTHFGWGAGSVAFHDSQTALGSELFPSGGATVRNAFSSVDEFFSSNQELYYGELLSDQSNIGSVSEIALFNASSGGTMLCRRAFYRTEKTSDLELQDEYAIGVGRR